MKTAQPFSRIGQEHRCIQINPWRLVRATAHGDCATGGLSIPRETSLNRTGGVADEGNIGDSEVDAVMSATDSLPDAQRATCGSGIYPDGPVISGHSDIDRPLAQLTPFSKRRSEPVRTSDGGLS